ncbi:MAG: amino acid dehydrogenase [Rubrivivax sp. SCN 71-131]|nr:MAG: amino acid dehydrogenase [Rubrivivax sp. SCN 71-131]
MQSNHDVIVIGAGVVGCSIAFHLTALGARDVRVIDRLGIGNGTSAQSSGILRTHYSVPQNVELARRSFAAFERFAEYVADAEADAGLVRCGYLIAAPEGPRLAALQAALAQQQALGIPMRLLDVHEAAERLPIARFDDAALIGFEPEAGFADAYLVATGFARAARRLGARFLEGVAVQGLLREGGRITGVQTDRGPMHAGLVISAQNIWTAELQAWSGIEMPLYPERHRVFAFETPAAPYTRAMPVYKDLGSPGMLYCRSYGGRQMLVSEGIAGERLTAPEIEQADIPMDAVIEVGEQVAGRFPAYAEAGLASSWTGVYDVTPDWNPVLGPVPGLEGLLVAFGFSGHGFKLSPAVGRLVAQMALGQPTGIAAEAYAIERFAQGRLLTGAYGAGAVS